MDTATSQFLVTDNNNKPHCSNQLNSLSDYHQTRGQADKIRGLEAEEHNHRLCPYRLPMRQECHRAPMKHTMQTLGTSREVCYHQHHTNSTMPNRIGNQAGTSTTYPTTKAPTQRPKALRSTSSSTMYRQRSQPFQNKKETLRYSGSTGLPNAVGGRPCTDPHVRYDDGLRDVARVRASPRAKESEDTTSSMTSMTLRWRMHSSVKARVKARADAIPLGKVRAKDLDDRTQSDAMDRS